MMVSRRVRIRLMALPLVLALGACLNSVVDGRQEGDEVSQQRSIEEVLEAHTDSLMAIPGVVGTGIGKCDDELCIAVLVAEKTPALVDRIPSELEGYRVDVRETGPFRPRDTL